MNTKPDFNDLMYKFNVRKLFRRAHFFNKNEWIVPSKC